jgi:hypothetical protein
LWHLANAIHPSFNGEEEREVLSQPFYQLDARGRVATLKLLAYDASQSAGQDFYRKTEVLLNTIDNTLRPERNRFAHDLWDTLRLIRSQPAPKVVKPQSRRLSKEWLSKHYGSIADVFSFRDHIVAAIEDIEILGDAICGLFGPSDQPPEFRAQLPAEWKSSAHHDWQGLSRLKLPPQSSPE